MTKYISVFSFFLFLFLTGTTCKEPSPTQNCTENCGEDPVDTTNHTFTWQLDTIGAEGGIVEDVAIIDENNIWAVGEFYKVPWGDELFNFAHFDGSKWVLVKNKFKFKDIYPESSSNDSILTRGTAIANIGNNELIGTANAIYKFGSNQKWDFIRQGNLPIQSNAESIWGTSADNIYFGGTNQNLARWDGSSFQKINTPPVNSPSTKTFHSITGTSDGSKIWANVMSGDSESRIISVLFEGNSTSTSWTQVYSGVQLNFIPDDADTELKSYISDMWAADDNYLYILTSFGIYKYDHLQKKSVKYWRNKNEPVWGALVLAGVAGNDMVFTGHGGLIYYFNGAEIKKVYSGLENVPGLFESIRYKSNLIVAVGRGVRQQPLVLRGKVLN